MLAAKNFRRRLQRRWSSPPRRWSTWPITRARTRRKIRSRSRPRRWRGSTCRTRSSCATARRISSTCFPATAIRPATTPTCGRKCSTPTPLRRSRKPAIRSIPTLAERLRTHIYAVRRLGRSGGALHGLPRQDADGGRDDGEARAALRRGWRSAGPISAPCTPRISPQAAARHGRTAAAAGANTSFTKPRNANTCRSMRRGSLTIRARMIAPSTTQAKRLRQVVEIGAG